MIHKTRGIVLGFIQYRETSIIVKIFTEEFGMQSYIVNKVRSTKGKSKISFFQPLTLLNLVVYHRQGKSINRIAETECLHPYRSIPFEINKSSVALFLSEFLGKCLKEEGKACRTFQFMLNAFQVWDLSNKETINFHLHFLLQLSRYLGFDPVHSREIYKQVILHAPDKEIAQHEQKIIDLFLQQPIGKVIRINNLIRRNLLEIILDFYKIHFDNLRELKSITVLKEVMN